MSSQLSIQALEVPSGTPTPANIQSLIRLVAQYLEIQGVENYTKILVGTVPPSSDDEDAVWLETDSTDTPQALKIYDGSGWRELQFRIPFGSTRPVAPKEGDKFYDTAIEQELVYMSGSWRTSWGGKGQRIFVHAPSREQALERYPGWDVDEDAMGMFLRGVGGDFDSGDTGGSETITLTKEQLPAHQHELPLVADATDGDKRYIFGTGTSTVNQVDVLQPNVGNAPLTANTGEAAPVPIVPAFIAFWVLKRL